MSDDEGAWLKRHGIFLDEMLSAGVVVAHGPVLDSKAPYGLSLYQIADSEDIAAKTAQDPIVMHGIGHYEHVPMLHIKARV
jgi:hypothetical protein